MDILTETQNLWQRFQQGGAFRAYLAQRLHLVVPAALIFVLFSVATTAGTIIALGGTRSILVMLGLLAAPFVLLGSLYFQVIVFLLWLENRAIELATHHAARTPQEEVLKTYSGLRTVAMSFGPAVLGVGAAFLLLPLWLLSLVSAAAAVLLLLLILATPAGYALLDR